MFGGSENSFLHTRKVVTLNQMNLIRYFSDFQVANNRVITETYRTNLTGEFRKIVEVEPPSPLRYLMGAVIMMIGVVLPVGYMMFRNKRVPSTSSYSKQT
ncbi:hypothetical protein CICLE_v10023737mg [Citrus x clementina]|uniref:Uncharacterized protein n=1 Tax=Citrus clementina TaxID=85681 RepID=V4T062_CITCL|nr:hypothetical protein CICLE_v10023737mg [Citrus x clementina]